MNNKEFKKINSMEYRIEKDTMGLILKGGQPVAGR